MAKPIKETPVLVGKDAKRFWDIVRDENVVKEERPVRDRIKKNYDKIKNITNF